MNARLLAAVGALGTIATIRAEQNSAVGLAAVRAVLPAVLDLVQIRRAIAALRVAANDDEDPKTTAMRAEDTARYEARQEATIDELLAGLEHHTAAPAGAREELLARVESVALAQIAAELPEHEHEPELPRTTNKTGKR